MKKYFLFILFVSFFWISFVFSQSKEVSVKVFSLGLVIWTPANLNLWSVIPWNTIEVSFSDYFWVEDLRGSNTGYYTTIQCDGFYGPNNYVITGVQILWDLVELVAWIDNHTLIYSNLNTWTDITIPKMYLYKNDNSMWNYYGNKYGNKPSVRVSVPIDAPAGTYKGKITYTLYDMSFNY